MDQPTGFAGRLKALREGAGLSQRQLAERVGLNPFTVAKLEQGLQEPGWPVVLALAGALGVGVQAFIPKEGETGAAPPKRGPGRPAKRQQGVGVKEPARAMPRG